MKSTYRGTVIIYQLEGGGGGGIIYFFILFLFIFYLFFIFFIFFWGGGGRELKLGPVRGSKYHFVLCWGSQNQMSDRG